MDVYALIGGMTKRQIYVIIFHQKNILLHCSQTGIILLGQHDKMILDFVFQNQRNADD